MSKHKRDRMRQPDHLPQYEFPNEYPNYPQPIPFQTPLVEVGGKAVRMVTCVIEDPLLLLTRANRALRLAMVKEARRERIDARLASKCRMSKERWRGPQQFTFEDVTPALPGKLRSNLVHTRQC